MRRLLACGGLLAGSALWQGAAEAVTPLNMEVEWCLQGDSEAVTGFFTEVLGLSSGLRDILPKSRLVKSVFDTSFNEPMISPNSSLYDELFEKERENIRHLISNEHVPISPGNSYLKFLNQSGMVDAAMECASMEEYTPPPYHSTEKRYLDSSRPVATLDAHIDETSTPSSQTSCCIACAAEPLCLGWTISDNSCHLQTRFEKIPQQQLLAETAILNEVEQNKAFSSLIKDRKYHAPRAVIFHGTMCVYQNLSVTHQKRDINTIYIGRYMFERGSRSLHRGMMSEEYKVFMCLLQMDEVWVPTPWMKRELEVLSRMVGFNFPVIAVVPEAVDASLFDPSLSLDVLNDDKNLYQFVSIFKWEERKGWDVLLKAYWGAFNADDDVILRLHTYRPSFLLMHGQTNITENLEVFAREEFGKNLSQLARVSIGEESICNDDQTCASSDGKVRSPYLNRVEMRQLLQASDAFVLPTRGEGWCLPAAEAMAMALPIIITNYSGPTAFAYDNNSYLIPILEEANDSGFIEPDVNALAALMKHVRENPDEAALKGLKGRETMLSLSPHAVVSTIADRLRELVQLRGWEE